MSMKKFDKLKNISKGKRIILLSAVALIVLCLMFIYLAGIDDSENRITAAGFFAENKFVFTAFPMLLVGIIIWLYIGEDIKSGTIKNRLLTNSSRFSIFVKYIVLGIFISGFISMLLMVVPLLVLAFLYGWGNEYDFTDTFIRLALTTLPYMRIASFIVLILLVCKRIYLVLAIGVLDLIIVGIVLEPGTGYIYTTGYANITALMKYETYHIYNIKPQIGFVDYYIKQSVFYDSLFFKTIIVSIIIVLMNLFLGYLYFRNDPEYQA